MTSLIIQNDMGCKLSLKFKRNLKGLKLMYKKLTHIAQLLQYRTYNKRDVWFVLIETFVLTQGHSKKAYLI